MFLVNYYCRAKSYYYIQKHELNEHLKHVCNDAFAKIYIFINDTIRI